jgi:hypothetical protein
MNAFFQTAAQKLGFRQKAYRQTFAEGSPANLVLVDLANFARAFDSDNADLDERALLRMSGRRDMFFRIIKHLKFSPSELEHIYRPAIMSAATRLQRSNPGDEE